MVLNYNRLYFLVEYLWPGSVLWIDLGMG
jgi:hypothetical protein